MENQTQESKFLKTNSFTIIGTLKNVETKNGVDRNGQEYISVDATVESNIKGVTNTFDVNFYSRKMTNAGKESGLYTNYVSLPDMLNKKVQVDGSIRENRYWSTNLNQMVSAQLLAGRYVRTVHENETEKATFVLGGFVASDVIEKTNKKDEVYRYDIKVAQSNYNDTNMSAFVLHMNPEDRDIVQHVSQSMVGDTIEFNGELSFVVNEVTVEDPNAGFGTSVTRTYKNRQKSFFITGGTNPFNDDRAYDDEIRNKLINAYKNHEVELAKKAKTAEAPKESVERTPVTKRQASLI